MIFYKRFCVRIEIDSDQFRYINGAFLHRSKNSFDELTRKLNYFGEFEFLIGN